MSDGNAIKPDALNFTIRGPDTSGVRARDVFTQIARPLTLEPWSSSGQKRGRILRVLFIRGLPKLKNSFFVLGQTEDRSALTANSLRVSHPTSISPP